MKPSIRFIFFIYFTRACARTFARSSTTHIRAGAYLLWEEEQGVPRFKRRVYFRMEKGEVDSLPPPMGREGKSLWLLDFEAFAAKVRGQVPTEELDRHKQVVIHIHQLSEEVETVCRNKGVVSV